VETGAHGSIGAARRQLRTLWIAAYASQSSNVVRQFTRPRPVKPLLFGGFGKQRATNAAVPFSPIRQQLDASDVVVEGVTACISACIFAGREAGPGLLKDRSGSCSACTRAARPARVLSASPLP